MIIALALLAIIAGTGSFLARKTTISVIINKDETTMATLKERLAALEATQVDASTFPTTSDVAALADRVSAVEAEIGNDPAPTPQPLPEPVEQPLG